VSLILQQAACCCGSTTPGPVDDPGNGSCVESDCTACASSVTFHWDAVSYPFGGGDPTYTPSSATAPRSNVSFCKWGGGPFYIQRNPCPDGTWDAFAGNGEHFHNPSRAVCPPSTGWVAVSPGPNPSYANFHL
jgi:hypothetical protein